MRSVIILGLTPQGLSLLRILSRAGIEVHAVCTSRKNVGYHSKYGKKYIFNSISELKNIINGIISTTNDRVLCYITSGEILALILREYPELYNICDVVSGPYDTITKLAHKDIMYDIAISKGFNVSPYITLDKCDISRVEFPCIIKRNYEIPLFFKTAIVNNSKELYSYISKITDNQKKDIIIQKYITIDKKDLIEISAQFFFSNSCSKGCLITNQKRRLKKGITSFLVELSDSALKEKIEKLCRSFITDLNYTGFAEFEFMYNSKNEDLYFIEINTRTCGLQSSMNYKFNNLADAIINPYNAPNLSVKNNHVIWMNIQRDIRARFEKHDFRNLLDIFKSHFDILDFHDIKPFIRQFI